MKNAFLENEKSITLRVRSSGSAFFRNYQELKDDHTESDRYVFK